MLFNTLSYIAFLLVAVPVYWALRPVYRSWLILAASLLFYGLWRVEFVALIVFSALVDYILALKIHGEERTGRRKLWLVFWEEPIPLFFSPSIMRRPKMRNVGRATSFI